MQTLDDWLARLETLSAREIDLGLERVDTVLARLALVLPEVIIHVAGTNGKGSCVAMLESLLQSSRRCVGCYTSPHIISYNERIRVAGQLASDEQIIAAFERVESARDDVPLTYFEFGTLAALVVLVDAGVDTAILEVGMGGRLDAVNAIEPTAGMITNVSLDHCDWLGDDIETIALEKAGIMRANKPIVFGSREIPRAITKHASATGARLLLAGRDYDWSIGDGDWSWYGNGHRLEALERPASPGEHQVANAAAVLALLEELGHAELLRGNTVNRALAGSRLEGRMQRVDANGAWILDVAHNPAAAAALAAVLDRDQHAGRTVAIVGMLDDKDVEGVVTPLAGQVDDWIAVTADSTRAIPAGELGRRIANATNSACLVAESLDAAMDRAREIATPSDRILVTGSFYLVGPVLNML